MANKFHEMFTEFKPGVIDLVKKAIADGLWKAEKDQALVMMQNLVNELAAIYKVPTATVMYGTMQGSETVFYDKVTKTIVLPKVSITTLLNMFRAHIWYVNPIALAGDIVVPLPPIDVLGWSLSVFANASPKAFDRAWRKGTIGGMPLHPDTKASDVVKVTDDDQTIDDKEELM
jgi:hypothetical protein